MRWAGRPGPVRALWRTVPIWLMGIPWLALSGGMLGVLVASIFFSPKPDRFISPGEHAMMGIAIIFLIGFSLIGIGMVGAPFWVWWKSRRMVYVVTDRRLIRIGWGRGRARQVKSFNPARLVALDRKQKADGSGTLTVTVSYFKDSDGETSSDSEMLVNVPDVAVADRLLREMMERGAGFDITSPVRDTAA